jgi:hypothetical protein
MTSAGRLKWPGHERRRHAKLLKRRAILVTSSLPPTKQDYKALNSTTASPEHFKANRPLNHSLVRAELESLHHHMLQESGLLPLRSTPLVKLNDSNVIKSTVTVAVGFDVMYSAMVLCCSCCALNEAAAGSIYMTYL